MPDQLTMRSPDHVARNVARIADLFPHCVTESIDDNGGLTQSIDFDLLRQELSGEIVDGPLERYHLNWPGKREAILAANAPIAKTLRPCREESVDFDTTRNLFIEGDNLEALKLLQETYLGKVRMIFIDPPYNTGNDFVYNDNFRQSSAAYLERSLQQDDDANRLTQNSETNGRFHSDWLSFIYPRLKLAKNLLSDDGLFFVTIDDGECANLKTILDELFGRDNFLANIAWEKRYTRSNNANCFYSLKDSILVYRKSSRLNKLREPRSESNRSIYANPDDDPRGDWTSSSYVNPATKQQRPNLVYPIIGPDGRTIEHPTHAWKYSREEHQRHQGEKRLWWGQDGSAQYPRLKNFLAEMDDGVVPVDIWKYRESGTTDEGGQQVKELFESAVFDNPKPTKLIRRMIGLVPDLRDDDIILDFFAGSGSTGQAVWEFSQHQSVSPRFVLIQLPEQCQPGHPACEQGFQTITEITKERLRRHRNVVFRSAKSLPQSSISLRRNNFPHHPPSGRVEPKRGEGSSYDLGFRVLKIDSSNMEDVFYAPAETSQAMLSRLVDNVKPDRSAEDLLFQVLLNGGIDLAAPIHRETIHNRDLFIINNSDSNAPDLIACFDTDLPTPLIKDIANRQPQRAVFRDHCYQTDDAKQNLEQIFQQISPHTQLMSL